MRCHHIVLTALMAALLAACADSAPADPQATQVAEQAAIIANGDPQSRRRAVEALASIAHADAPLVLRRALADSQPAVQAAAAIALAEHNDAAAVPLLLPLAQAKDAQLRHAALRSLSMLKDARAVPVLQQALVGDDPALYPVAANGLGALGDAGLVALRQAVDDPRDAVAAAALAVVGRVDQDPATTAVVAAALRADAPARVLAAVEALAAEPRPSLAPALIARQQQPLSPAQRKALGDAGKEQAAAIRRATQQALLALMRTGDAASISALIALPEAGQDDWVAELLQAAGDAALPAARRTLADAQAGDAARALALALLPRPLATGERALLIQMVEQGHGPQAAAAQALDGQLAEDQRQALVAVLLPRLEQDAAAVTALCVLARPGDAAAGAALLRLHARLRQDDTKGMSRQLRQVTEALGDLRYAPAGDQLWAQMQAYHQRPRDVVHLPPVLLRVDRERFLPLLIELLRDPPDKIRWRGLMAGLPVLAGTGDARVVPLLAHWYQNAGPMVDVRRVALRSLGRIPHADAAAVLVAALQDPALDQTVQRQVLRPALVEQGAAAVPGLLALVRTAPVPAADAPDHGLWAAQLLGEIGAPAQDDLVAAVDQASGPVLARVLVALAMIADADATAAVVAALDHDDPHIRSTAAYVLAQHARRGALPALRAAQAKESDDSVRRVLQGAVTHLQAKD